MNLIIEQGNTLTKVAVFCDSEIKASYTYSILNIDVLMPLFADFDLKRGILSTVIHPDKDVVKFLKSKLINFIVLNEDTLVPIIVEYNSRKTLGQDRLAAVVGAFFMSPEKDVLVIDAGTAITYEFISASGVYLGGNISPGMTTRFKALNYYTERLPLLKEEDSFPEIGNNTNNAIVAGVVKGIIYEMDGYIDDYKSKYPLLLIFLTGGHSFYFERRLKNTIFADINLVLRGLNRILEYNDEN